MEEADRTAVFGPDVGAFQLPATKVFLYEWLSIVFLLCGLPAAVAVSFDIDLVESRVVVGIVVAIALVLVLFYPWKRRERRRERRRVNALMGERGRGSRSKPRHFPWDGAAFEDRPALLGDDPEAFPPFVKGGGALLLRAKAHRHLWIEGDGVCVRDVERARLAVAPPKVRIDGLEQPATWGNWWYPLAPGTHTVEVDFNTVPPGFAAPQRITERCEFEVRAGEAAAVRADAHLNVDRGPGEAGPVRVRDGLLYVEPEEFQAEWMDDPVKRLAYWKTPV